MEQQEAKKTALITSEEASLHELAKSISYQSERRKILVEFASKQLSQENGDFNEIKGKKALGKPGAEKFCALFGVTIGEPELAQDIMETLPTAVKESGAVVLKVKLYKDEKYLGSGIGARNLRQDGGDLNKMMKMAKKSAIIDAVISTFGLSDLFTQDAEETHGTQLAGHSEQNQNRQTIQKAAATHRSELQSSTIKVIDVRSTAKDGVKLISRTGNPYRILAAQDGVLYFFFGSEEVEAGASYDITFREKNGFTTIEDISPAGITKEDNAEEAE